MMNSFWRAFMVAAMLVGTPAFPEGERTCALIADSVLGFSESAVFELAQVELSKQPGVALLDRSEIDKVLEEQTFQMAFAPEGGADRRRLGSLLKADILVILHARGTEEVRSLDIVIAETKTGLRVLRRIVSWDEKDPATTVSAIVEVVKKGVLKSSETTTMIAAVPPFVSDDLSHQYDSMQAAYAELVGRVLSGAPGVHLVELAEAKSIGEELRLTDDGSVVRPLQPCYFLGRYRNSGAGENRTVHLSLEVRQGDNLLFERSSEKVAPASAAVFLQKSVEEYLGRSGVERRVPFDPEAETKELMRRAEEFRRLGQWEESFNLLEAAILIEPESVDLRYRAVEVCGHLVDSLFDPDHGQETFETKARKALAWDMAGLDHLEVVLRSPLMDFGSSEFTSFLNDFWHCTDRIAEYLNRYSKLLDETNEISTRVDTRRGEVLLSFYEYLAEKGGLTPVVGKDIKTRFSHIRLPSLLPPERVLAFRLGLIKLFNDIPEEDFLLADLVAVDPSTPRYQKFLEDVERLPGNRMSLHVAIYRWKIETKDSPTSERLTALEKLSPRVEHADLGKEYFVRRISASRDELQKKMVISENTSTTGQYPSKTPRKPGDIAYLQIESLPRERITGWIRCATGTDLLWGANVYVMKEKGKARAIYSPDKQDRIPKNVVFDGRFAWASLRDEVLVIDPEAETFVRITGKDGLPPGDIKVGPLEPGHVVLAGYFGRSWCATARRNDDGSVNLDVFHEARSVTGETNDPTVAFGTNFVLIIRKEGKANPTVLIGNGVEQEDYRQESPYRSDLTQPVMADPVGRTVTVLPYHFPKCLGPQHVVEHNGNVYCAVSTHGRPPRIWRMGGPEDENDESWYETLHLEFSRPLPIAILNGECYVVGPSGEIYLADLGNRTVKRFDGKLAMGASWFDDPLAFHLKTGQSYHYGMIRIDPFGSCFEIRFLESSEKPSSHVLSKEGIKETDLAIRSVVVRIYRDWEKEPTTYEKLTCLVTDDRISIGGGDYPNTGIGMMAGEDQTDPALRDLMSEFIIVWRLNDQPDTLSNFKEWKKGREDPAGYAFGWQSSPQPMLVTFTDAVGNPLSGATASYYTGNSESDSLVQKSVLDQAGQMVIPLHGGSDTSAYSFLVACSKYETAGIRPSHRRSRIYRLPIVRKGTLEWDRSIRGTVIDPEGKAVVEARVSCRISGPGFSPDRWFVMTDGQGRFVYYPPMATTRTEDKQTGYFDPSLSAPDITVEPPRSSGLLNFGNRVPAGGEIKIALERGQRYHTFAFEDVSGRLVNAGYVGVRRVYVQPNHYVLSAADLLKGGIFPNGRYEVAPSNDVLYDDLEVTADSPEQLVFRPMPERVFSGRVLDATTGKTLEDVFIAISDSGQSAPDFTLLSREDLRTIRDIVPPSGQSQQIPPTYPFSLQFKELVRTDPQGSFTVKVERGRDANGLVFFKENYKPLVSRALFGVRVDISSGRKSRKMHESNLEVKLMPLQNR